MVPGVPVSRSVGVLRSRTGDRATGRPGDPGLDSRRSASRRIRPRGEGAPPRRCRGRCCGYGLLIRNGFSRGAMCQEPFESAGGRRRRHGTVRREARGSGEYASRDGPWGGWRARHREGGRPGATDRHDPAESPAPDRQACATGEGEAPGNRTGPVPALPPALRTAPDARSAIRVTDRQERCRCAHSGGLLRASNPVGRPSSRGSGNWPTPKTT